MKNTDNGESVVGILFSASANCDANQEIGCRCDVVGDYAEQRIANLEERTILRERVGETPTREEIICSYFN